MHLVVSVFLTLGNAPVHERRAHVASDTRHSPAFVHYSEIYGWLALAQRTKPKAECRAGKHFHSRGSFRTGSNPNNVRSEECTNRILQNQNVNRDDSTLGWSVQSGGVRPCRRLRHPSTLDSHL